MHASDRNKNDITAVRRADAELLLTCGGSAASAVSEAHAPAAVPVTAAPAAAPDRTTPAAPTSEPVSAAHGLTAITVAAPSSAPPPRGASPLSDARTRIAELEARLLAAETRSANQARVIVALDAQVNAAAEDAERAVRAAEEEWDAAWTAAARNKRRKQAEWVATTQARMDAKDNEWRAVIASVRKDARATIDANTHEMRSLREHLRLAVSRLQSDVSTVAALLSSVPSGASSMSGSPLGRT